MSLWFYLDWLFVTSTLMVVALVLACLVFVVMVLTMCVTEIKDMIHSDKCLAIMCLTTAACIFASLFLFANRHHSESWTKANRTSKTFIIAIFAFLMYLVSGVILLWSSCSKTKQTEVLPFSTIVPPPNWTKYTTERSIDEWHIHVESGNKKKVYTEKVTGDEKTAVTDLVMKTWDKKLVGKGKDAEGLAELDYNSIEVKKIERIENPSVFKTYAQFRNTLLERITHDDRKCVAIEDMFCNCKNSGQIKTTSLLNTKIFTDLHPEVNEHYMFHGAPVDCIDTISEDGIATFLSTKGMMGNGFYAAESSTKSDQYTDRKDDRDMKSNKKMLLVRVLLGDIFLTNRKKKFVCPPPTNIGHGKYDSIVFDRHGKHREFVIHHSQQCYPEYIITYRRISE